MEKIEVTVQGVKKKVDYTEHFANIAKVNNSMRVGVLDHYKDIGLTYIDVPEIVGITGACENIDTLFRVKSRLDIPLFFTQTGQLSLEQALQSFPGVCTVIISGRDEEFEDERHLRQFRLTEEEFDCTMEGMSLDVYDEELMLVKLLEHIQKSVRAMISGVIHNDGEILSNIYGRDLAELKFALENDFIEITYEDVIGLLNKEGYPDLKFGDDLEAPHEAKVTELLNDGEYQLPIFITRFPEEIKFFNMKVSTNDPRVALSADLILPYSGESAGSAVREHDYTRLKERLLGSVMFDLHKKRGGKIEDFDWYLNIMKRDSNTPHAGYGIGNERVLQYIFGESDIRNVSIFSLIDLQAGDWRGK